VPSPIVPYRTDSEDEDSFLQITMGDIGDATAQLDSFCRAGKSEEEPSSKETKREVFGHSNRNFTESSSGWSNHGNFRGTSVGRSNGNFTGSSLYGQQHLTRRPLERYEHL
jgi:hypothetical protein